MWLIWGIGGMPVCIHIKLLINSYTYLMPIICYHLFVHYSHILHIPPNCLHLSVYQYPHIPHCPHTISSTLTYLSASLINTPLTVYIPPNAHISHTPQMLCFYFMYAMLYMWEMWGLGIPPSPFIRFI